MNTPNATPTAEYAERDPHTLVLADNVRDRVDLDADPQFVASIREHGVLLAINAIRRAEDAAIVVEDGQRRALAARAVALPTVPVLIRTPSGEGKRQHLDRIARQIVANDRREALTPGQRAAGSRRCSTWARRSPRSPRPPRSTATP